jgi:hypothetical protein
MKALAVLAACLCFAVPAQAFVHAGGPHPGPGRAHHQGYGGYGLGFWGGVAVPEYPFSQDVGSFEPAAVSDAPPPGVIAATIAAAIAAAGASSGPNRPAFDSPRPKPGPHIIYIGQQPAIHGPKVIYGGQ